MKKILITSALPYVNNVPHLGTAVCILSADTYSRFLKLQGKKVLYVCGTDDHGTTSEIKALEEGVTPRELVAKYYKIHKDCYDWLLCDFDCFGGSSLPENHEITKEIFAKLDKNGFISEDTLQQLYCEKDRMFLADRFVAGRCPSCGYDKARGDQCDSCGKLLDAVELIDPKCKMCGTKPVVRGTKHLFIDLPKLQPQIQKWFGKQKGWSQNAKTKTDSLLREGLKKRCITRDLKWGIPVQKKGYEDKVFYSWFDAPIAYIGITMHNRDDWKDWWLSKDTTLAQFMGKDNIIFHSILFPGFLIGTGDPYVLVSKLAVNEYLNYENAKFSKSLGTGVFIDDAMGSGIIADVWRYYLLVNRPEKSDTEFTWQDFLDKNNGELVANFGNLVNRTVTFINRYYDSKVPKASDATFIEGLKPDEKEVETLLSSIQLKDALKRIMAISKKANQYFQEQEPWTDPKGKSNAIGVLANTVKDLAIMLSPFMPGVAARIQDMLGIKKLQWKDLGKITLKAGHPVKKAEPLFKKIDAAEIDTLRQKFSGQDDFATLDLRTAKVLSVEDHPSAEKLYILSLELGKERRQVVAGLRQDVTKKDLLGKTLVVVANLKKAVIKGVESSGMVIAAVSSDNKASLIEAKGESGEQAFAEGIKPNPKPEIDIKDFSKLDIRVDASKNIIYKGRPIKTKEGNLTASAANKGDKIS